MSEKLSIKNRIIWAVKVLGVVPQLLSGKIVPEKVEFPKTSQRGERRLVRPSCHPESAIDMSTDSLESGEAIISCRACKKIIAEFPNGKITPVFDYDDVIM